MTDLDLYLEDHHHMLRDMVREFAEAEIAPVAAQFDESEEFPLFQHTGIEFIYMLEGEVVYQHADEQYRLRPGDSLFFEADVPHGPAELAKLPIRFLSIIGQLRGDDSESSVE